MSVFICLSVDLRLRPLPAMPPPAPRAAAFLSRDSNLPEAQVCGIRCSPWPRGQSLWSHVGACASQPAPQRAPYVALPCGRDEAVTKPAAVCAQGVPREHRIKNGVHPRHRIPFLGVPTTNQPCPPPWPLPPASCRTFYCARVVVPSLWLQFPPRIWQRRRASQE